MSDQWAENAPVVPPTTENEGSGIDALPELDTQDNETPAVGNEGDNEGEGGAEDPRERFIPRERFNQVNAKLQRFSQYEDLIAEVEAMGGPAALRERQAQMQKEQDEQSRKAEEARLEAEADKLVEEGQLSEDLRDRYLDTRRENESLRPLKEQQAQREYEQKVNDFLGTAVPVLQSRYPDLDESAIRLAVEAGKGEAELWKVAETTHNRMTKHLSDYTAKRDKANGNGAPTPEAGGGGGAPARPSAIPDPVKDPQGFADYRAKARADAERNRTGDTRMSRSY